MDHMSNSGCPSAPPNFSLDFNSAKLSDRVLRIEIFELNICNSCNSAATRDEHLGTLLELRMVPINSAILAANSPFFYKLFSNGMRESEQPHCSLRISSSEEDALMDLLQFTHSGKLNAEVPDKVLDVLIAADKFEVLSCVRHCSYTLKNLPMTQVSALLYLELPSSVLLSDGVQALQDAARLYLTKKYRGIYKNNPVDMDLPLGALEVILSSDDFLADSEDDVYDLVLKWATAHFTKLEERRDILGGRLSFLIRFPMMTSDKLREVLTCSDFGHEHASRMVLEALFFKAETSHRQRQLAMEETLHKRYREQKSRVPVRVLECDSSCTVFLEVKLEECRKFLPNGSLESTLFHIGDHGFNLRMDSHSHAQGTSHRFGLYLVMEESSLEAVHTDVEFAVRIKPKWDFEVLHFTTIWLTQTSRIACINFFPETAEKFIENDIFFQDSILHLRVQIVIKEIQW